MRTLSGPSCFATGPIRRSNVSPSASSTTFGARHSGRSDVSVEKVLAPAVDWSLVWVSTRPLSGVGVLGGGLEDRPEVFGYRHRLERADVGASGVPDRVAPRQGARTGHDEANQLPGHLAPVTPTQRVGEHGAVGS